MITITKGRLLTIKQWRETYGPGSNVVLPAEEAEELARIALVSLEAEPVAKIIAHYPLGVDVGKQKFVQAIGELPDFGGYLFAAPPAPIVPEEATPENVEMLSGYVSTYKLTDSERDIAAEIWNACRAAMLQAEPVSNSDELPLDYLQGHKDGLEWAAQLAEANHPQTGDWLYDDQIDLARAIRKGPDMPTVQGGNSPVIPDGWISCSERMPEETGDIIVVSDGIVMSGISYSRRDGFYMAALEYDDDEPIDGVTHWMPLPEPPQEAK
ncbi:DUF551 domain-containing protein [Escherichia coli]|nr:DUF551 domain-containing protein [Escherichia coli]EGI4666776.1 DUF551 domain-containing protein [Escherichia coli]HAM6937926.1 DUF551 domain-containing protein [Escherichia coli]